MNTHQAADQAGADSARPNTEPAMVDSQVLLIEEHPASEGRVIPAAHFLDGKGELGSAHDLTAAAIDIALRFGVSSVGVGTVLRSKECDHVLSSVLPSASGNRIVLIALLDALEALEGRHAVTVTCASDYLITNMMQGNVHRWRRDGWQKPDESEVETKELWEQLLALSDEHRLLCVPPTEPRSARMVQAEAEALAGLLEAEPPVADPKNQEGSAAATVN